MLPSGTAAEVRGLLRAVVEQGTGRSAAVEGCVSASLAHEAPFICGKDSLNNEFRTREGELKTRELLPVRFVPITGDH